jgi:hypothetical protein
MNKILAVLAMLFLALLAPIGPASAAGDVHPQTMTSTDVTDIWYVATESGWGLQANQSANFVFITLFVYDVAGQPRWFTANLTQTAGTTFTGPLYQTTGPYYGGVFNPALVTQVAVGSFTFVLDTTVTAHIAYNVGPVAVAKNIQRQPLLLEPISGTYTGTGNITAAGCSNPANNGYLSAGYTVVFNQVGNAINGSFQFAGAGVCSFTGTYNELGRMGSVDTSYVCPNGEAGAISFFELTNRIGIISGRISGASSNIGCSYSGRFTVLNPTTP